MTNAHDDNRCVNCVKMEGVHMDDFTGHPVCLKVGVRDGDIVCQNFVAKLKEEDE